MKAFILRHRQIWKTDFESRSTAYRTIASVCAAWRYTAQHRDWFHKTLAKQVYIHALSVWLNSNYCILTIVITGLITWLMATIGCRPTVYVDLSIYAYQVMYEGQSESLEPNSITKTIVVETKKIICMEKNMLLTKM